MTPVNPARALWADLVLAGIGLLTGMALRIHWWAYRGWFHAFEQPAVWSRLLLAGVAGVVILFALRALVRRSVALLPHPGGLPPGYRKHDALTYLPLLLPGLGAFGVSLSVPLLYLMALLFFGSQLLLLAVTTPRAPGQPGLTHSPTWPALLFLLSGVAALMYQVVWQRVLFAAYGVTIESVTIIVSVFMFGLGIGALVGGRVAERFPDRLPLLFMVCEVGIGLFGLASLPLIRVVTDATVTGSLLTISAMTFVLLCVPTMFMGATLPILVGYLYRHTRHVGRSVAFLYALNTLGSAIASLVTVDLVFLVLGQGHTVLVAAGFNLLVAGLVYGYTRALARQRQPQGGEGPAGGDIVTAQPEAHRLAWPLTLLLAVLVGYISLSQEILWVRAIAFASGGLPHVFGHVLGFFLLGVAGGALLGKRVCDRNASPLAFVAGMLVLTGVLYFLALPCVSRIMGMAWEAGLLLSYVMVALIAFLLGGVLPVLCHYGSRPGVSVSISLSRIYMANILGSTAGPLITGFLLLNLWTLQRNMMLLSLLCLAAGGILALATRPPSALRGWTLTVAVLGLALLPVLHQPLYRGLLERLSFHRTGPRTEPHRYVLQNRSGIITVDPHPDGDIVYGGGVYDGRFNVDPVVNSNGIDRAYMIAALHPAPEEVLEIGLSTGSWSWVVAAHDGVRRLSVIEINPAYPELMGRYREQATLAANPRFELTIDDGRRWLKRYPDARFDVILMNTTFHWRSNATNLLSREFLELCRRHLKQGGMVYYNATGSEDVRRTAAEVFRYVTGYGSFVAASDRPFTLTPEERRANLLRFEANGRPILDPDLPETARVLEELVHADLADAGPLLRQRADLGVITDDNMLTEFRASLSSLARWYRWSDPARSWTRFREGRPAA